MQSIQYHHYGGPEEMSLEEVEIPKPGRGQVRVRVRAAATNPADWGIRAGHLRLVSGSRFPRGLGHDFAGVVDAIGPEVTRLKVGDEVFGIKGIREAGAFAEYLVIAVHVAFSPSKLIACLFSPQHTLASGHPTPQHMAGITKASSFQRSVAPCRCLKRSWRSPSLKRLARPRENW